MIGRLRVARFELLRGIKIRADHPLLLTVRDRDESGEARWQTLAVVEGYLLLLIAHTVREETEDGESIEP